MRKGIIIVVIFIILLIIFKGKALIAPIEWATKVAEWFGNKFVEVMGNVTTK